MKKLHSEFMLTIEPGRMVGAVVSKNGLIKFPSPVRADSIECPNCGLKEGIWNPPWNAWSCLQEGCIKAHAALQVDPSREVPIPSHPEISLKEFDVPEEFWEYKIQDASLSKEDKEWIFQFAQKPIGFAVFSGQTGRGKTSCACAILNEYRANKGLSARFINVSELNMMWREVGSSIHQLASKYINCELLVL